MYSTLSSASLGEASRFPINGFGPVLAGTSALWVQHARGLQRKPRRIQVGFPKNAEARLPPQTSASLSKDPFRSYISSSRSSPSARVFEEASIAHFSEKIIKKSGPGGVRSPRAAQTGVPGRPCPEYHPRDPFRRRF